MTKTRKVELLYKKAKGLPSDATPQENAELRRYGVSSNEDSFYTTKANISAYVSAVDNQGFRYSFYDWCMNNGKADKRRKGSGAKAMAAANKEKSISFVMIGWLLWGMALYWMTNGALGVGACAIAGGVISFLISRFARASAPVTLLVLPILLAVFFGSK